MSDLKPILLVEDNPNDIELTLAALEKSQLANEIVICRDGAEALDYLYRRGAHDTRDARDPAVVLLDLKLPKVDGLEVLAKVKGDIRTRSIPVVVLTSSREETDIVRSYDLGVNAFVVKPVGFTEFFEAIQELGVFWAVLNEPPPHRGRLAIEHLRDEDRESGRDGGLEPPALRILLLEDSDLDTELLGAALDEIGHPYSFDRVMTRAAFTDAVAAGGHTIILADYVLPTFDGLSALDIARARCPTIPFVFVSGTLGEDVAVEALKRGATDYVTKQRLDRLPRTILRALSEAKARVERERAVAALHELNETLEARVAARTRELAAANAELHRQIGERERVEEALRQSQRLEAVGQLTSGVAHDFNNLLTVISGNIEFLGRAVTDERSQRRLAMMRGAADRGARLTAQLLAFSRRQRLEPTPVELNHTVGSMRDLLQSSIGGGVRIETTLQPDLWSALVDATQIELVVLNLAINARDAMAVGGCLTIETANVVLTEPPSRPEEPAPGAYVMVAVSDTGTGIAPDVLARVFEPFFTTKAVDKGSGLGLAQVYGFVKQSGGGVRIDTRVGEGTSVRVYLPRVETGEAPLAQAPQAVDCGTRRAPGDDPILLVVDDDGAVREITTTILSELGYGIRQASSGLAALHALEADPCVDLVLLDFAMPGMNGAEVACEIRRRWPHLPVLFVTGYADTDALMRVGEVGTDHVVQKPFRDGELQRKVAAALACPPAQAGLRLVASRP